MNNDPFTIRLVVAGLLAITLLITLGGIFLAFHDKSLPDAMIAMGGTALGGMATFLVSTRTNQDQPPNSP